RGAACGKVELAFFGMASRLACARYRRRTVKLLHLEQAMKKLPISVSMVSGAEAGRIGRALGSVAEWTSEIIVVLNEEARDGTEEIALRYGARVFREPWRGYKAQKNSAAAKATQ